MTERRSRDGAFTGSCTTAAVGASIRVSAGRGQLRAHRLVTKPTFAGLSAQHQAAIEALAGGRPDDGLWSHQLRVAEGELDMCIWFCGDTWDHAAPSVIVEEAGGRFTDHAGGKSLDTRTAIYSNGASHDEVLAALGHARA